MTVYCHVSIILSHLVDLEFLELSQFHKRCQTFSASGILNVFICRFSFCHLESFGLLVSLFNSLETK